MVAPSFEMVTSPISSTIIKSNPNGPRVELTVLATEMAALTFSSRNS